jgi:hypothetical protein
MFELLIRSVHAPESDVALCHLRHVVDGFMRCIVAHAFLVPGVFLLPCDPSIPYP